MKNNLLVLLALTISTSAAASSLSKPQVRAVVRPIESSVRDCAQAAGVGGTAKAHWTVKPDGTVADLVVTGKHASDAAGKCITDAINGLKFPETTKGSHSKWRFQLGPKAPSTAGGTGTAPTSHHKSKAPKGDAAPAPAPTK